MMTSNMYGTDVVPQFLAVIARAQVERRISMKVGGDEAEERTKATSSASTLGSISAITAGPETTSSFFVVLAPVRAFEPHCSAVCRITSEEADGGPFFFFCTYGIYRVF